MPVLAPGMASVLFNLDHWNSVLTRSATDFSLLWRAIIDTGYSAFIVVAFSRRIAKHRKL
jgi:hypothetical protein